MSRRIAPVRAQAAPATEADLLARCAAAAAPGGGAPVATGAFRLHAPLMMSYLPSGAAPGAALPCVVFGRDGARDAAALDALVQVRPAVCT